MLTAGISASFILVRISFTTGGLSIVLVRRIAPSYLLKSGRVNILNSPVSCLGLSREPIDETKASTFTEHEAAAFSMPLRIAHW